MLGNYDTAIKAAIAGYSADGDKKAAAGRIAGSTGYSAPLFDPSKPSFVVGAMNGELNPKKLEAGAVDPIKGHLPDAAYDAMLKSLRDAQSDMLSGGSGQAGSSRAATGVTNSLMSIRNPADAKEALKEQLSDGHMLRAARMQIACNIGELTKAVGGDTMTAQASVNMMLVGLQQRGFSWAIEQAFDKSEKISAIGAQVMGAIPGGAGAAATLSGTAENAGKLLARGEAAHSLGMGLVGKAQSVASSANLSQFVDNSLDALKHAGVSKEAVKNFTSKHTGKLSILFEVADHTRPIAERVAYLMEKTPELIPALILIFKDKEARTALGDLGMGLGDAIAMIPGGKAAGSAMLLAGAGLSDKSAAEVDQHLLRLSLAVAVGAVGGLAGTALAGPFGTFGGAVAGQAAGAKFADFIIDKFNDKNPLDPMPEHSRSAKQEGFDNTTNKELADAAKTLGSHLKEQNPGSVLAQRVDRGAEEIAKMPESQRERIMNYGKPS